MGRFDDGDEFEKNAQGLEHRCRPMHALGFPRVGSDLSLTQCADDVEPSLVAECVESRSNLGSVKARAIDLF